MQRGGIPLSRDYDIAIEQQIRDALKASIPNGNCFAYRGRFVIAVDGNYEPDTVMAATGCPVINGKRWRGYLGDNRPAELRTLPAIAVRAGKPFSEVHIGGDPRQPPFHT